MPSSPTFYMLVRGKSVVNLIKIIELNVNDQIIYFLNLIKEIEVIDLQAPLAPDNDEYVHG